MPDFTDRVEELAHEREVPESRILEEALEHGVEEMWEQSILSRYLQGEIKREDAVELVGLRNVTRAEKETQAVEDDVEWGSNRMRTNNNIPISYLSNGRVRYGYN